MYLRFGNTGKSISNRDKISIKIFKETSDVLLEVIKNKFNNIKSEEDYNNFIEFCKIDRDLYIKISKI